MIVNPKQIMKPIYNVWILLFCLTFTSCYEDDSIIPTPDPLAQAGGFEFPQGDNSWDNDAMKIYQDFGVKIIYKDITEKDLNKNCRHQCDGDEGHKKGLNPQQNIVEPLGSLKQGAL